MPATSPRALAADRTHLLRGVPGALSRGKTGSLVATLALALFAVIFGLVRSKRSAATDVAITMKFQRRRHPGLARVMAIASWPGFPPQSRLIPPALVAALWVVGLRLEAAFQLLAWGTSGISYVFKSIMRRPRPQQGEIQVAIARIGGTSFPSGHVLGYVLFRGFLACLTRTLIDQRPLRLALLAPSRALVALLARYRRGKGPQLALATLLEEQGARVPGNGRR